MEEEVRQRQQQLEQVLLQQQWLQQWQQQWQQQQERSVHGLSEAVVALGEKLGRVVTKEGEKGEVKEGGEEEEGVWAAFVRVRAMVESLSRQGGIAELPQAEKMEGREGRREVGIPRGLQQHTHVDAAEGLTASALLPSSPSAEEMSAWISGSVPACQPGVGAGAAGAAAAAAGAA
eukprot:evm.model.NODE_21585_length_24503_cov_28.097294.12